MTVNPSPAGADIAWSTIPDIVCDVEVPQDDKNTYVPQSWPTDLSPNFPALGMAVFLLSHDLGQVIPGSVLVERHSPHDPPLAEVLGHLVEAGYLVPDPSEAGRLLLVHPDRLGPLSAA